jgi:cytochrome c oxidase cbb3-type subunit 4
VVSTVEIEQLRVYMYIIGTALAVGIFYYYIIYLYRSEKKGRRDYEKYGNLALDDELHDKPLERKSDIEKAKKE